MSLFSRALTAVAVVLAVASNVAAQESINYASVSGRVTDPQGAVVPGAHRHGPADRDQRHGTGVTDDGGRFRFPYLRSGRTN